MPQCVRPKKLSWAMPWPPETFKGVCLISPYCAALATRYPASRVEGPESVTAVHNRGCWKLVYYDHHRPLYSRISALGQIVISLESRRLVGYCVLRAASHVVPSEVHVCTTRRALSRRLSTAVTPTRGSTTVNASTAVDRLKTMPLPPLFCVLFVAVAVAGCAGFREAPAGSGQQKLPPSVLLGCHERDDGDGDGDL